MARRSQPPEPKPATGEKLFKLLSVVLTLLAVILGVVVLREYGIVSFDFKLPKKTAVKVSPTPSVMPQKQMGTIQGERRPLPEGLTDEEKQILDAPSMD